MIDRGYEAADRLVTWLFLSLVPALAECFAVCLLFLLNYTSPVLAIMVCVVLATPTTATFTFTPRANLRLT